MSLVDFYYGYDTGFFLKLADREESRVFGEGGNVAVYYIGIALEDSLVIASTQHCDGIAGFCLFSHTHVSLRVSDHGDLFTVEGEAGAEGFKCLGVRFLVIFAVSCA